jgi:hypothetical protein
MIYENCNGKIGSNGLCEKCLQPSETTSVYCLRLIPIPFPSAPGEKKYVDEGLHPHSINEQKREDELTTLEWNTIWYEAQQFSQDSFSKLMSESFSIKRKQ